jgi:cysteine desulfurase/selenocysteine lyase
MTAPKSVKADFPILRHAVHGKPLVYLDSGATTQKPTVVLDRMRHYYENENANIHRGVHTLSQRATAVFEAARNTVHSFVHGGPQDVVVFTRGTTDAINLLASSLTPRLKAGDAVLITELEHHSNIVPWQFACQRSGAKLLVAPIFENGEIDLAAYEKLLQQNVKVVSFSHISNALGSLLPAEQMIALAKSAGAVTVIDGAQGIGI